MTRVAVWSFVVGVALAAGSWLGLYVGLLVVTS